MTDEILDKLVNGELDGAGTIYCKSNLFTMGLGHVLILFFFLAQHKDVGVLFCKYNLSQKML